MVQLRSLQEQAAALRVAFDEGIQAGKTLEEIRVIYFQLKEVEQLVYERKMLLKEQDAYRE